MSYRTHKRRPTSISGDLIFESQMHKSKSYVAADGQVLQSSMVKNGSPSKRQLTGSTSQVRFSLPPPSDSNDSDDFSDHDSANFSFEDDDQEEEQFRESDNSFDRKPVFNFDSRELIDHEEFSRGRSLKRTNSAKVSDTMRELLSNSPERNKLFIRPNSELNERPIPIPVELSLPPPLSPNNKSKARPKSLVFNGYSYEPLDSRFLSRSRQIKHLSLPASQPNTPSQPSPISLSIPQLSKDLTATNPKYVLDNEEEIKNPSVAAKIQNNNLNKSFAFPARPQSTTPDDSIADNKEKALPTPPSLEMRKSLPVPLSRSPGLGIFTPNGQPFHTPNGFMKSRENQTTLKESAGVINQRPIQQIPNRVSPPHETNKVQNSQQINQAPNHQEIFQDQKPQQIKQIQKPQQFNHSNSSLRWQPIKPIETYVIDDSFQESIQDSIEFNASQGNLETSKDEVEIIEDSIDVESILSATSEDITYQLMDLGNLILASSSALNVSNKQLLQFDQSLQEKSIQESAVTSPVQLSYPTTESSSDENVLTNRDVHASVGESHTLHYHSQPEKIYPSDNIEADKIRSRSMNLKLHKHVINSPLSHSSYESEFSEPFSNASSAATTNTNITEPEAPTVIDLTNNDYDLTYVKGKLDRLDSFRTVVQRMNNGDLHEIIVIDDDSTPQTKTLKPLINNRIHNDKDESHKLSRTDNRNELQVPKSRGHGKSKSVSSQRASSAFSFETVASEVQLRSVPINENQPTNPKRYSFPRTYTEQNKSIIELCDETMLSSKEAMDHVKRQKTILLMKQRELIKQKKQAEDKLKNINKLKEDLAKAKFGHQKGKSQNIDREDEYFDYANNQSYDFQSFITSKSTSSIVSLR